MPRASALWVTAVILLMSATLSPLLQAAPYFGEELYTYTQPNGESFKVRLHGDEFFAYQETEDGFLVVRDPNSGAFCYAKVTPDGSRIVSTGVKVGANKPPGLKPKQRLAPGKAMSLSLNNRNLLGADLKGRRNIGGKLVEDENGEIINIQPEAGDVTSAPDQEEPPIASAPPASGTVGTRVGIVLLAYFPDRPADVTKTVEDIDNYCNAENYTANNNAASIYKYFDIQSNGKLSYKNTVTAWFEAANPRSYYTDNSIGYGTRARELIREGLAVLKAQGFDFTSCDGNGDGRLDGVNIFYAGSRTNAWSEGIWPHQSSSSWTGLTGTGLSSTSYDYQITDMPASLTIGTFCHENGHMICDYPDLYSYDGNAANLGGYSLMHSSGSNHPRHIDPYLKIHSGWADVVELTSSSSLQCAVQQDRNFFYRYRNPSNAQEYFLFEVRGNQGYEGPWGGAGATNPGDGLAVYHALETGSNTRSSIYTGGNPAGSAISYTKPYELMLVESSPGTTAVPWYTDPSPGSNDIYYAAGVSSVSDSTSPALKFWAADGRTVSSGANIHTISGRGATMTFICGSGSPPASPVIGATATQFNPQVDFGSNAAATSFAVFNQAGGTLSYSISDNASWLSCSPTSGSATTEADLINVSYSTSGLSAGAYSATITVNGGGAGTINIPVSLTVRAQPTLTASTSSISEPGISGTVGPQRSFTIGNSGGGSADYTISKTQTWLSIDRSGGTVATEQDLVTVSFDATGVSPGTYNDTITITSATATNSPITIAVTFVVGDVDMILTAPDGGESWYVDSTQQITWASTLGGNVKIELLKGGVLDSTISAGTVNSGSYNWTIPSGQTLGSDYKIRITSIESPTKTDQSFANFTIGQDLLALALDTTNQSWYSSGDLPWFRQTTTTHDGVDAAESGAITHNQISSMQTTFTEAGTLTFWWKVSSESGYDYLELYVNDVLQTGANARISGDVNWVQRTVTIPSGTTTVRWTYDKDGSVDRNLDTAWVDQVVFTPNVPTYTVSYNGNGNTGGGVPSSQTKTQGVNLTLATNSGNLVKTGFAFQGWNTQANGNGTDYAAGGTYSTDANVTLYAKWQAVPTYTISYNGNGNTAGSAPSNQTKTQGVALTLATNSGNLAKSGFGFSGWNTNAAGSGTSYAPGGTFNVDANTTLYAKWNASPVPNAGSDRTVNLTQSAPWTPAEITTLVWLDADDASTIAESNGKVTQWSDKSTNGNHAYQETDASRPVYDSANKKLTFDGGDIFKVTNDPFNGLQNFAVISLQRWSATSSWGNTAASYHGENSNGWQLRQRSTSYDKLTFTRRATGAADDPDPTPTVNDSDHIAVGMRKNSQDVVMRHNGAQILSAGNDTGSIAYTGTNRSAVGGRYQADAWTSPNGQLRGDLKEVVVIENATDDDVLKAEGYLAHKWAISLPAGHPYETEPPGGSGLSVDVTLSDANVTDPESDSTTVTWSLVSTAPSGQEGNVSFDNPNLLNATATFTAEGVYTLRLTANDGYSTSTNDVVITVGAQQTPYQAWTGGSFAKTFSDTLATSDADGDGWLNYVEFAFGTDPTTSDSGPMGYVSNGDVTAAGLPILEGPTGGYKAVFTRRKDHVAAGLTYTVEFSCDLQAWQASATGIQVVTGDPSSGDHEAVSVPFPASVPLQGGGSDAPKFFRVRVSMN